MAASTSDVGLPVGDGLGQEEFDEEGEDEEDLELDKNLAFIEIPGQRCMGAPTSSGTISTTAMTYRHMT